MSKETADIDTASNVALPVVLTLVTIPLVMSLVFLFTTDTTRITRRKFAYPKARA